MRYLMEQNRYPSDSDGEGNSRKNTYKTTTETEIFYTEESAEVEQRRAERAFYKKAKKKLTKILNKELYFIACKLGAGASFGELALINAHAKRAATIRCCETTHFANLTKDDFDKVFLKIEK